MASSAAGSATEVSVQLSECRTGDVRTVFEVLSSAFGPAAGPEPKYQPDAAGTEPHVRASEFTVTEVRERPGPTALQGAVAAELQGSPRAVDRLKEVLGQAFTLSGEDTSYGDQEEQIRLQLESR